MFKMKEKLFKKRGGVMAFAAAVAVSFSILSPLSSELVPSVGIAVSAAESDNTAASNIPANALKWNGHSYALFNNCSSWKDAVDYCESIGGHLATITSSEENTAVYNYLRSCGYTDGYFGFTDSDEEGTWIWANGEKSDYTNWNSGEPNGQTSKEDYAMFYWKYQSGTWNDANFSGGELFICEWDFDNEEQTEDIEIDVQFYDENGNEIDELVYKRGKWNCSSFDVVVNIKNNTDITYDTCSWKLYDLYDEYGVYLNETESFQLKNRGIYNYLRSVQTSNLSYQYKGGDIEFEVTLQSLDENNNVKEEKEYKYSLPVKCDVFKVINGSYDVSPVDYNLLVNHFFVESLSFKIHYAKNKK